MDLLLFDFGGTLDSDGLPWLDRFRVIYKEEGLAVDPVRLDRAFYDADDHLGRRHALAGLGLEETVRLQVADVLQNLGQSNAELADRVSSRFLADCRRHLQRNRPTLERLARKHKLGIVSNWYGNLESVLRSQDLLQFFGAVADSSVVGCIKPEPALFLAALEKLGGKPPQALMVGDNVKRDMRGAEALGMRHALLAPAGAAGCCEKAIRLSVFTELEHLLELEGLLA